MTELANAICPICQQPILTGTSSCSSCSKNAIVIDKAEHRRRVRNLVDNPLVVFAVLFGMTGGFGLPLLWISRGFTVWQKAILTVVVLLYTALILWLIWVLLGYLASQWDEIRRAFA